VGSSPHNNHVSRRLEGHAGDHARAVFANYGIDTMWTLSGAHVFPLYDAATQPRQPSPDRPQPDPPMRLIDVRHEQTAVFGAEATAKLTRRPGLAVVTAGPGVTNAVSGIAQAQASGVPLLTIGGRAPQFRWGSGALQELDHPPILAPVTKKSVTARRAADVADVVDDALQVAAEPHRGPVFVDVPMDELYSRAEVAIPAPAATAVAAPDPDDLARVAALLANAERPVLVLGSDVWMDGAEEAARRLAEETRVPVITNGMGRGILPRGHELLVTRARSAAFKGADLVLVAGTPLDFRLGYGIFGGADGSPPAPVVHLADSPGQLAAHVELAASAAGDLSAVFDGIATALRHRPAVDSWLTTLRDAAAAAVTRDADLLGAASNPIHPARIYGELLPLLEPDAVVIGDGGDFVSWAGKFVEPGRPGCWLDPGPFGCLGAGAGAAAAARIARPSSQVVLLYGDGAAGMSLMDIDTLVRHDLPVVIVVGNNGAWGLEKHPMQFLYGYDVAADLRAETGYDQIVTALGGAGETVTRPDDIGSALRRAFSAGVPYLVNVLCDPAIAYPRSTTGV
jgi:acetolactate synthase-1/2/3 large subunit